MARGVTLPGRPETLPCVTLRGFSHGASIIAFHRYLRQGISGRRRSGGKFLIPVTGGLYLVIQPAGAKSWAWRYRFNGKAKKLTIGPVYLGDDEDLQNAELDQPNTLAGARKLAGEAALQVARGIDPAKV